MNDIFLTYPGGKNGSGVYQKLINLMPPHRTYVEAFLGGGAIMRAKRPAVINIGIDLDINVVKHQGWIENLGAVPGLQLVWADARRWLEEHAEELGPDALVYADPPYLMSTRSSQRQFYAVEMAEEDEHRALIRVLRSLRCMVMLSGYWSTLYAELLQDWRTYSFQAMTRGGTTATEWVWMNFPEPVELHDYRFLGETFRERERIKRKKSRWTARLERMAPLERQALLMAIQELRSSSGGDDDGRRQAAAEGAGVASSAVPGDDAGGGDVIMGEWGVQFGHGGLEYTLPLDEALSVDGELRACIGENGAVRSGGGEE